MDFQRFGIDPRLAQAAEGLPTNFFFYEKMLAHVVEAQENVCVKIALDEGREEVLLLPALQWLLSGEARKALVVVPDVEGVDRCASAIGNLGSAAGISVCRVTRDEAADPAIRLDGDPSSSSVLLGMLEDLLAIPELDLRGYGFLVVDGVDRLSDIPTDAIRKFSASLLPSWERRSVLACARFSVKAKNLAWDLADNPTEISIEGEVAKAQSVLKETWSVPVDSKLKFLLGLLEREKPSRLCVFCNLKDTASDVCRRLAANGVRTDSILGGLLPERKFALVEKFRAGDSTCLLLTDEGADGLTPGVFPLIVNYDIPLEPELFVKRLEMLDRSDPGAKVVSIACDRYIYGLPAVEQYIDAKLDAVPAEPSMLAAVDRSEGMASDRRPKGDSYPRDARRGQPQRRESSARDGRQREAYPRDSYPREGRSPDIRKSISEATGGALDMSGALPPDQGNSRPASARPAQGKNTSRGEPRRGGQESRGQGSSGGRPSGNKEGRRDDARRVGGKPAQQRAADPRQQGSRPQAGRPPAGKPVQAKPGNPYELPMEERMKIYREKYGRNLGEEKAGGGRGGPRNEQKGGQRGPKAQRGGQPGTAQQGAQQGGPKRQPSQRGPGQGQQNQRKQQPQEQRPPRPQAPRAPQKPQAEPARKPEGVMGRLLGAFRKKKS